MIPTISADDASQQMDTSETGGQISEGLPPGLTPPVVGSISVGSSSAMAPPTHSSLPTQGSLSVKATSNPKKVAGMIAHTSRDSEPLPVQAIGSNCVNQAIKAIAIARNYVTVDNMDFLVEPERVADAEIKNLIKLNLIKVERREKPDIEYVDLKSAMKTESNALAGAISKNIREEKNVRVAAIGPRPVFRAVDAIIRARRFLEDDGIDLQFQPSFTTVQSGDQEINAIILEIFTVRRS